MTRVERSSDGSLAGYVDLYSLILPPDQFVTISAPAGMASSVVSMCLSTSSRVELRKVPFVTSDMYWS